MRDGVTYRAFLSQPNLTQKDSLLKQCLSYEPPQQQGNQREDEDCTNAELPARRKVFQEITFMPAFTLSKTVTFILQLVFMGIFLRMFPGQVTFTKIFLFHTISQAGSPSGQFNFSLDSRQNSGTAEIEKGDYLLLVSTSQYNTHL